jgi:hypothetical protein
MGNALARLLRKNTMRLRNKTQEIIKKYLYIFNENENQLNLTMLV